MQAGASRTTRWRRSIARRRRSRPFEAALERLGGRLWRIADHRRQCGAGHPTPPPAALYGTAVGADYRFSPDTLAGFALAGGGTNFGVANGGSGRSDLFQAGAFVRHDVGAAYVTGALAYGWQDVTTDRTVTVAGVDRLRARFNANAWSGASKAAIASSRHGSAASALRRTPPDNSPRFDLPAYAEQRGRRRQHLCAGLCGSKSVTATRSELGLRTDKSFAMADGDLHAARPRRLGARLQYRSQHRARPSRRCPARPSSSTARRRPADAALTTASAEMKWRNGWSAAATFEGEFSDVTAQLRRQGRRAIRVVRAFFFWVGILT